jgi:hypothetical protein
MAEEVTVLLLFIYLYLLKFLHSTGYMEVIEIIICEHRPERALKGGIHAST